MGRDDKTHGILEEGPVKRGHLEEAEGYGRKERDKYLTNMSRITEMKERALQEVWWLVSVSERWANTTWQCEMTDTQTQCIDITDIFQRPFALAHKTDTYKILVTIILHDNLQCWVSQTLRCSQLSHMIAANTKYVSRRILAFHPSQRTNTLTHAHTTLRTLPTSNISLGSLMSTALETGDFVELILL